MHSQFEPSEMQQNQSPVLSQAEDNRKASATENVLAQNEVEAALERFLDQVCAQPSKIMTDTKKAEMRQELRAHLIAAATAYEELGSEPKTAMQEAIARFGNPAFVGKGLQQAYRPSRLFRQMGILTVLSGYGVSAALWDITAGAMGMNYLARSDASWAGDVLGLILALIIWRKQLSVGRASVWGGSLYTFLAVAFISFLAVYNQHFRFDASVINEIAKMCLFAGLTGAGTGTLIGAMTWLLRCLEQKVSETKTLPPMLS